MQEIFSVFSAVGSQGESHKDNYDESRVSDPDPYWIRIQSDHWIRIRIRNLNTDPDPGGQK
jgi:hypothetical protein